MEIKIIASFDPHKKCIFVDGQGAGMIKLETSADQLAGVLTALANLKGKSFEVIFKSPIDEGLINGKHKSAQIIR